MTENYYDDPADPEWLKHEEEWFSFGDGSGACAKISTHGRALSPTDQLMNVYAPDGDNNERRLTRAEIRYKALCRKYGTIKLDNREVPDFSYNDWIKGIPRTIVFQHPKYGKVALYTDAQRYKDAVSRGEIAFGPTEIMRLFIASDMKYIDNAEKILAVKKFLPDSKVIDVVGDDGGTHYKLNEDDEYMVTDVETEWRARRVKRPDEPPHVATPQLPPSP